MKTIWNGITKENAVFSLLLGLCSTLAVTTTFESSYMMGVCVLVVLILSNTIISIIRKLVPDSVQIPTFVLIIGTIVTLLEIILYRYVPNLYSSFGIYLPLIVVNCIVLGRALNVASKEKPTKSILDAIGIGVGFTVALMVIGAIREIIGNNTITIIKSLSSVTGNRLMYRVFEPNEMFPISFLLTPAGAFFIIGLIFTIVQYLKGRKKHESD